MFRPTDKVQPRTEIKVEESVAGNSLVVQAKLYFDLFAKKSWADAMDELMREMVKAALHTPEMRRKMDDAISSAMLHLPLIDLVQEAVREVIRESIPEKTQVPQSAPPVLKNLGPGPVFNPKVVRGL